MSGTSVMRPRLGDSESASHSSPPARRNQPTQAWRQPRFLAGCAMIVGSVLIGSFIVGTADDRVMVWSAKHDMAAGTVVTNDDLVAVPVALDQAGRYVSAEEFGIMGRRLGRAVGQDEIVAITSLGNEGSDTRLITVPVEPVHAPTDLVHGDRVDVYSSPRDAATAGGASRLVLMGALVAELSSDVDTARGELAVVLEVRADQAAAVVSAARTGVLDLVRVPVNAS